MRKSNWLLLVIVLAHSIIAVIGTRTIQDMGAIGVGVIYLFPALLANLICLPIIFDSKKTIGYMLILVAALWLGVPVYEFFGWTLTSIPNYFVSFKNIAQAVLTLIELAIFIIIWSNVFKKFKKNQNNQPLQTQKPT
ncbi:MAG: hypothetical protein AAB738_02730 [Patescibacteria group bacterium]